MTRPLLADALVAVPLTACVNLSRSQAVTPIAAAETWRVGEVRLSVEPEIETTAEVHFGWVLEGRAVQDVWIAPSKAAGSLAGQPTPPRGALYGTTLRVYDPAKDEWGITWVNPVTGAFNRMVGRAAGKDIVQEYREADGRLVQWCFFEIKADSFHWVWRESADEGAHWTLRGEFYLRRRSRSPQALSPKP